MKRALVTVAVATALIILVCRFGPVAAVSQEAPRIAPATAHEGGYLNSYIALLRSDLRAKKSGFITEGLSLTDKESAAFRPIYERYELDLVKFNDARLQLIKDYGANYDKMTDAKAKELTARMFALEERRVGLKRDYFKQLEKVLPGKTVARYFMLERRFDLLLDLKIASEVPIIE